MGLASKLQAAGKLSPAVHAKMGAPPPPPAAMAASAQYNTSPQYNTSAQYNAPAPTFYEVPPETSMASPMMQRPQMGGGQPMNRVFDTLQSCVSEKKLDKFYDRTKLNELAISVSESELLIRNLTREWNISEAKSAALYKLALWDIVMLCDDSGSMSMAENGERIRDLELIINYIARASALFNKDGISVRFLNSNKCGDHLGDARQIAELVKSVPFQGITPLGTSLNEKVLKPFFYDKLSRHTLRKPLLVIVITDGQPQGEPPNALHETLKNLYNFSGGGNGVAIQIAQVGSDSSAQQFLEQLDNNRVYGSMVDVTSNIELEQQECMQKGHSLSVEDWICKLLLGAIDSSYDAKDE